MERSAGPKIVGLAGGTASGKSTLASLLAERHGSDVRVICHDRYYRDIPEPSGFNYDHPDALDTELLVQQLEAARSGQPVELPRYDFPTHTRLADTESLVPSRILVVEGILVLADPRLRSCFDFMVYVHAAADLRLCRRLRRDLQSRGRSVESTLDQYMKTVRPMHEQFVLPSRMHADLSLSGEDPVEVGYERLVGALRVMGWLAGP